MPEARRDWAKEDDLDPAFIEDLHQREVDHLTGVEMARVRVSRLPIGEPGLPGIPHQRSCGRRPWMAEARRSIASASEATADFRGGGARAIASVRMSGSDGDSLRPIIEAAGVR
jgi:hypothetical protein